LRTPLYSYEKGARLKKVRNVWSNERIAC